MMTVQTTTQMEGGGVQTSTLAVISLIAGLLGITIFPVLGSIVAIIIGGMARREIRESAGALGGDGMATAGLVLGWIGLALVFLAGCLFACLGVGLCAGLIAFFSNLTVNAVPYSALLAF